MLRFFLLRAKHAVSALSLSLLCTSWLPPWCWSLGPCGRSRCSSFLSLPPLLLVSLFPVFRRLDDDERRMPLAFFHHLLFLYTFYTKRWGLLTNTHTHTNTYTCWWPPFGFRSNGTWIWRTGKGEGGVSRSNHMFLPFGLIYGSDSWRRRRRASQHDVCGSICSCVCVFDFTLLLCAADSWTSIIIDVFERWLGRRSEEGICCIIPDTCPWAVAITWFSRAWSGRG